MINTRDGMDQEQWRAIGAEANKWHKMRQFKNVEDHAGCSWTVVYSHLSKVYNELYGKGGLKLSVQAIRVMSSMPMNVAYGAMHPGEELSSAPSVLALEHMVFGAMTHTEFKELSDGQRSHTMMVAFSSPPATVDDFAKLINGRYIQGGPGLLFKGPMSGQRGGRRGEDRQCTLGVPQRTTLTPRSGLMRESGCCDRRNQLSNICTVISLARTTSHKIGQMRQRP